MCAESAHEHECERQVQRLSRYSLCPRRGSRQPAVPCQELKKQHWGAPLQRDNVMPAAMALQSDSSPFLELELELEYAFTDLTQFGVSERKSPKTQD